MKYHSEVSKKACKQASARIEAFASIMVENFPADNTTTQEEAFDVIRTIAYELAETAAALYLAMSLNSVAGRGVTEVDELGEDDLHKAIEMTLKAMITDTKDVVQRSTGVGFNTEIVECSKEEMTNYKESRQAVKH